MDEAEHDVLAYMTFAAQHRTKLHSTDVMDKAPGASRAIFSFARATSWRRAERRLQAPPGRLIQALPA